MIVVLRALGRDMRSGPALGQCSLKGGSTVALDDCLWVPPSVAIVSHVTYGAITMCLVELLNCISVVPD